MRDIRQERGARRRLARGAQHFGDFRGDGPERIAGQRAFERRAGRARTVFAECLCGPDSRDGAGFAGQDRRVHIGLEGVGHRAQDVSARIDAHEPGFGRQRNRERLVLPFDPQTHPHLIGQRPIARVGCRLGRRCRDEAGVDIEAIGGMFGVDGLQLIDGQESGAARGVPAKADAQFGMAAALDPLVEKRSHVAAGRGLDRAHEIDGFDVALRVVGDVAPNRAAQPLPTEFAAQHVQHRPAFLVQVGVEELNRIAINVAHDRPPVALAVFVEILLNERVHVVRVLVPT